MRKYEISTYMDQDRLFIQGMEMAFLWQSNHADFFDVFWNLKHWSVLGTHVKYVRIIGL